LNSSKSTLDTLLAIHQHARSSIDFQPFLTSATILQIPATNLKGSPPLPHPPLHHANATHRRERHLQALAHQQNFYSDEKKFENH
jgi:hypothetical protein